MVYDAQKKDNELQSAIVFKEFSKNFDIPQNVVESVDKFIMATEHHMDNKNVSNDLALFLDFDLSILGSSIDEYDRYKDAIRQEYSHFSDEEFLKGRKFVNFFFFNFFLTDKKKKGFRKISKQSFIVFLSNWKREFRRKGKNEYQKRNRELEIKKVQETKKN